MNDTIAAIASPLGTGAVALIRVSGGESHEIVQKLCQKAQPFTDRQAALRTLVNEDGQVLDQVLLTPFFGKRSFTGEPTVEIATHGGALITQRVLEALIKAGARPAESGEFSQRAFLNGKLDLTQAEAIMDLISAKTDLALEAAHHQLDGKLSSSTEALRAQIIGLAAQLEAHIDFPEEDISPETEAGWKKRIEEITVLIDQWLSLAEQGRMLREGIRTVIYGKPNAGKSSLLNRLLGYERAIVSDTEGTTRDTVEEMINLRGLPIRLVDTAGVRNSSDEVESMGIERTQQELQRADLVIHIIDGASEEPILRPESQGCIISVANKSDQKEFKNPAGFIPISCVSEEGIADLEQEISNQILTGGELRSSHLVAINQRHQGCLIRAKESLVSASEQIDAQESPEFVSLDLREAIEMIGAIAGKIDTEDILGDIFANFCIGK